MRGDAASQTGRDEASQVRAADLKRLEGLETAVGRNAALIKTLAFNVSGGSGGGNDDASLEAEEKTLEDAKRKVEHVAHKAHLSKQKSVLHSTLHAEEGHHHGPGGEEEMNQMKKQASDASRRQTSAMNSLNAAKTQVLKQVASLK